LFCTCKIDERSRYPVAEIGKNTYAVDLIPVMEKIIAEYCEEKDQASQNYTKMARIKRISRKCHESHRQSNKNNTRRRQRLEERDLHNDWSIQTCSPSKHRRNTLQGVTIRNEA
jgi:hypothetical protein